MTTPATAPVPPGYAGGAERPLGTRPVTLVAAELVLAFALLTAVGRELLSRAPDLCLGPLRQVSPATLAATTALPLALGAVAGFRAGRRAGYVVLAMTAVSLAATSAPWLWCSLFARGSGSALSLSLLASTAALLGVTGAALWRWLGAQALALGLVIALLDPLRLVAAGFVGVLALGAAANLPLRHAGAALGVLLALLTFSVPALHRYLSRERLTLALRLLPAVALLAAVFSAILAERELPLTEARAYSGEVLLAAGGDRQRLALVSQRSHFELYLDRTLKLSSVDSARYAEALAYPALAAAAARSRLLLLGGGTGLVERELLRWPDAGRLTVVVTDRHLPEVAARATWPAASFSDARIEIVEAEPIVFLAQTTREFDVIVADLEDPVGYREAKHYTRRFFELLAARLAPAGVAALQAPSAFGFPRAHASVRATLAAAGLEFAPYHAALPALGEGSFFLLGVAAGSLARRLEQGSAGLPAGLRYLSRAALPALFTLPLDLQSPEVAPPNLLYSQPIVELYGEENAKR